MTRLPGNVIAYTLAASAAIFPAFDAAAAASECGQPYTVVRGDTLSGISLRAYGSLVYQPIYNANVDIIGTNPDLILVGQVLAIPCLGADGSILAPTEVAAPAADSVEIIAPDAGDDAAIGDRLVFTFNKASAPPFIINSGIIDAYLAEITEVTEGRVTFTDPDVVNRDHTRQLELVTSGAVDGAYVLNAHLSQSHPLLQLPMVPMLGGSAEQTAVSLWRLHEAYLSTADYFPEAELLGFISAPAAHIWRDSAQPVTPGEGIAKKNAYAVPYFNGLDTRGPAAMRAEIGDWQVNYTATHDEAPTFFLAHGAALALGIWDATSNVSVMEVDNGLYTPTFSVVLSNDAWARISPEDQQAIRAVSGEALAHRSAAWDAFDNAFRARMLQEGLKFSKADKALSKDLWMASLDDLNAWMQNATRAGIPASEAVNFYLTNLRSLQDRIVYRGDMSFVDQHPFWTVGQ